MACGVRAIEPPRDQALGTISAMEKPKNEIVSTLKEARREERLMPMPGRLHLVVRQGADEGAKFALDGPVMTGGRGEAHDIRLTDPSVSTTHFELTRRNGGIDLRDLGSSNGTYAGGHGLSTLPPKTGLVQIYPTSMFWAGKVLFEVVDLEVIPTAISTRTQLGSLYGQSVPMQQLFAVLERLAPTRLDVLLLGETGTGKEEIARTIHELSGRSGPFVALDSTQLTQSLSESRLMGHRKGAFTGASEDAMGYFEAANGGTLFIDEIGEIPFELQSRFLRVIDRKEVTRIGETFPRSVDVRLIAATHRNLKDDVSEHRFRLDLFQRIATMTLRIPPLRERTSDIGFLARHFLTLDAERSNCHVELADDAIRALEQLLWEGNVRQLRGIIFRTFSMTSGQSVLTAADLKRYGTEWEGTATDLVSMPHASILDSPMKIARQRMIDEFDRRYCLALGERFGSRVREAADHAGFSERHLRTLFERFGIRVRPGGESEA